jgi:hypothetical protein
MRVLLIVLGIAAGAAIAWGLLKLFPVKRLENKGQKIGLQIAVYIVFILLGFAFTSFFSLRIVLDKFIVNRIQAMEVSLTNMFPNTNIMETSIDTKDLVSMNNQIQQSVNSINTSADSFFEKLVFDTFIGKLSSYINAVNSGVTTLAAMSNEDGTVTLKVILYNFKDMALDAVSPYFKVGQIIILVLLVVAIGIYFGIYFYIKKGGALYNKSIVYGDVNNQS